MHITIKLYDDRLEIQSPGRLSGFVTLDNMKVTRHSRNPQIARVLNELGVVRELNEGIRRIYSEMEKFYLKEPEFSEPNNNSLLLVLDNNIVMRSNRKRDTLLKNSEISQNWNNLSYPEQLILQYMHDKGDITSGEASEIIDKGKTTTIKVLNNLIELKLIVWTGTSKTDTSGKYILKANNVKK